MSQLKKQRITADELISTLRINNVPDISSVKFCFLEHNGQISSFSEDDNFSLPVIIDGEVHGGHLRLLGLDNTWLKQRLNERHLSQSEIFIALSDGQSFSFYKRGDGK